LTDEGTAYHCNKADLAGIGAKDFVPGMANPVSINIKRRPHERIVILQGHLLKVDGNTLMWTGKSLWRTTVSISCRASPIPCHGMQSSENQGSFASATRTP